MLPISDCGVCVRCLTEACCLRHRACEDTRRTSVSAFSPKKLVRARWLARSNLRQSIQALIVPHVRSSLASRLLDNCWEANAVLSWQASCQRAKRFGLLFKENVR
jgi:hypothetical protein